MTQSNSVLAKPSAGGGTPAGAGLARHGRAFLTWWLSELRALLPEAARARLAGDDRRAGIFLDGDTLHLTDLRGGQSRPICDIDLAEMSTAQARDAIARALSRAGLTGCSVVLGLPEPLVLRRRESLPPGAERRLGDVLRLKLDSTAPLPPDTFHWGYLLAGEEPDGRLAAEYVLVKREKVEVLAARLTNLGVELAGVFPQTDLPAAPSLNLLPAHLRRERESPWSPLNKRLAALAGILAVLALILTFHRQVSTLDALNAELADLRGRAKTVMAMRTEAEGQLEAVNAVRAAKSAAPPLMGILDEVSRLLPDSSWVNNFTLRGREVQLIGQSQSAASLIGLIERSPLFANVRFGSPVVRDPKTGNERFNLQFDWVAPNGTTERAAADEGGR